MGFLEAAFGRQAARSMASQARLPIIKTPPGGIALRKIRPRRADGSFEKRTDVSYRCFILPYPVMVRTLEGLEFAKAGDWIVEGENGELWPVWREKAEEIYEPAS